MIRALCLGAVLLTASFIFSAQAFALRVKDGEYIFDKFDDLAMCLDGSYTATYCLDALDRWLNDNPGDVLKAAKVVRVKSNAVNAVPYFTQVKEKPDGFCEDEDLGLAVVASLALPSDDDVILPKAKELAFGECFPVLQESIQNEMTNDSVFKNTCKKFMDEGLLKGLRQKKCEALQ